MRASLRKRVPSDTNALLKALCVLLSLIIIAMFIGRSDSAGGGSIANSEINDNIDRRLAIMLEKEREHAAALEKQMENQAFKMNKVKRSYKNMLEKTQERKKAEDALEALHKELRESMDSAVLHLSNSEESSSVNKVYHQLNDARKKLYKKNGKFAPQFPLPKKAATATQPAVPLGNNAASSCATTHSAKKADCKLWDHKGLTNIPREIFVLWNDTHLFPKALELDADWKDKEPCFQRQIVTDLECRRLAKNAKMLDSYDALPLNVMRADVCRLLAIHSYGGIYMDLDVQWATKLSEWIDLDVDLIVGVIDSSSSKNVTMENWFFAAESQHPCLKKTIDHIATLIKEPIPASKFNTDPDLVQKTTGYLAFSEGMANCGGTDKWQKVSAKKLSNTNMKHHNAGKNWRRVKGFTGWYDARMNAAGWRTIGGVALLPPAQQAYVKQASNDALGSYDVRPLTLSDVKVSHPYFTGAPMIFSGMDAIDGGLDSMAMSKVTSEEQYIELRFETPMNFPLSSTENVLHCVKVFPRKDGDFSSASGYHVEALDNFGEKLFVSDVITSDLPETFKMTPHEQHENIVSLRIRRNGHVRVAEIQVFTSSFCDQPRRLQAPTVQVSKEPDTVGGLLKGILQDISHKTYRCPHPVMLGEKFDDNGLVWGCGISGDANTEMAVGGDASLSRSCVGVVIGSTMDSSVESSLLDLNCKPHIFDRRLNPDGGATPIDHTRYNSKIPVFGMELQPASLGATDTSRSLKEMLQLIGTDYASFLNIKQDNGVEWSVMDEVTTLGHEKKVDLVTMTLHLCRHAMEMESLADLSQKVSRMLEMFHVYSSVADTEMDTRESAPFEYPCIVKLGLIRKSMVEKS